MRVYTYFFSRCHPDADLRFSPFATTNSTNPVTGTNPTPCGGSGLGPGPGVSGLTGMPYLKPAPYLMTVDSLHSMGYPTTSMCSKYNKTHPFRPFIHIDTFIHIESPKNKLTHISHKGTTQITYIVWWLNHTVYFSTHPFFILRKLPTAPEYPVQSWGENCEFVNCLIEKQTNRGHPTTKRTHTKCKHYHCAAKKMSEAQRPSLQDICPRLAFKSLTRLV